MNNNSYKGVGLNLRLEFIDEVLEEKPKLPFFEVIVDNFFSKGAHHKKLEKIREIYPLSFHCVGLNIAGADTIDNKYLSKVKNLIDIYRPFQVSDHLCFQNFNGNHFHDLLPFPLNNESFHHIVPRINYIQEFLDQEILVENLSTYIEFKDSTIQEIDFLNQLSQTTGCFQLLDLNNIWVNELNLNIKVNHYLEKVNWDYIKEIHVAGPELIDDLYLDTHGTMVSQEVLLLVQKYNNKIKNIPLIYERDSNIPDLDILLSEVASINSYL